MRGFAGEIIDVEYILCVPWIPWYKELPLKEILGIDKGKTLVHLSPHNNILFSPILHLKWN
jgi:hypothetical protein